MAILLCFGSHGNAALLNENPMTHKLTKCSVMLHGAHGGDPTGMLRMTHAA